ncbi:MAG: (Fe-S)-binding protein [bacterium]
MFLSEKEREETIWACRFCPMCQVADRVGSIVRRESYTPRGRGAILFALDRGLLEWDDTVADIMYTTLNDGLIQAWCVGRYDHEELILDARARLFERGLAPEGVAFFLNNLRSARGAGKEPTRILREADVKIHPGAEVLLFGGCAVRESQTALVAAGMLFNMASLPFQVIPEEPCCGWPFYQLGDREGARMSSVRIAQAIRDSGAKTVVVLDGDCYRMLLTRNARFGGDLGGVHVRHITSFLDNWIASGNVRVTRALSETITYHDPCALARYCEELEAPRRILASISGGRLKEMANHGRMANCCGAGGMLAVHRPDLAREVAKLRIEEAHETGARILAVGCPRCESSLENANQRCRSNSMRIANLVTLVAEAAGLEVHKISQDCFNCE